MKKILAVLSVLAIMFSAFAESTTLSFSDLGDESIMVQTNTSQTTLDKGIKNTGDSILVYTNVPFAEHSSTMSIIFIDPLKIENISNLKNAKLVGRSIGYNASITLHFVDSKGNLKRVLFEDAVPRIPGEYELTWENKSYIADVRDRKPTLKPIWPFNDADLFLYEIEYHLNTCLKGYPYNAQEIVSIDVTYDKDTLDGGELKQSFEDTFGVESKIKSEQVKRSEKLRAEKKAAEDREKALMAE